MAPELLDAPTIGRGERPVQGWWWRGSQKPNKPLKMPEIYKNGEKMGSSAHVLACKMPFFAQKFFEEYINFKIVRYLSHYGVIPV